LTTSSDVPVYPNPPERRSSLAAPASAEKKLRKNQPPSAYTARNGTSSLTSGSTSPSASGTTSSSGLMMAEGKYGGGSAMNVASGTNQSRGKRLTNKIFGLGRSDTVPDLGTLRGGGAPSAHSNSNSDRSGSDRRDFNRSQSYNDYGMGLEGGATPPPISRYPNPMGRRPSTANSLDLGLDPNGKIGDMASGLVTRGQSAYQATGAYARRGSVDVDSGVNSSRKWFGLGKNGGRKQ